MLVFYICLSVFVSFVCSMLEAVILSLTPSYLASLKGQSNKLYHRARSIKNDLERPLASILTFNTIAHTVGAAGAGAQAQRLFGSSSLAVFSAILTFIILFFSEIIPKSIGAAYWKKLLIPSLYILKPMMVLSYPVVYLSELFSKLLKKQEQTFSRDEITAMAEVALAEGILDKPEYRKIKGIMEFKNTPLRNILTQKHKVRGVQYNSTLEEAYESIKDNTYSRLVVFGINKDDIKGYVLRVKMYEALITGSAKKTKEIQNSILIVNEVENILRLMSRLIERKEHLAAIIDKEGHFLGIITLEDIIEHLLNLEIFDELDQITN